MSGMTEAFNNFLSKFVLWLNTHNIVSRRLLTVLIVTPKQFIFNITQTKGEFQLYPYYIEKYIEVVVYSGEVALKCMNKLCITMLQFIKTDDTYIRDTKPQSPFERSKHHS